MLKNVKNASFGAFLWEKICIFQIKAVFLHAFYENYRRYFNTTESATFVYSGSVSIGHRPHHSAAELWLNPSFITPMLTTARSRNQYFCRKECL